jgi:hypothetical protein
VLYKQQLPGLPTRCNHTLHMALCKIIASFGIFSFLVQCIPCSSNREPTAAMQQQRRDSSNSNGERVASRIRLKSAREQHLRRLQSGREAAADLAWYNKLHLGLLHNLACAPLPPLLALPSSLDPSQQLAPNTHTTTTTTSRPPLPTMPLRAPHICFL